MKLSAYLSPSRHGVYYFRWPLPRSEQSQRSTIRVSLRTKCPDRAGDLARYLASCGRLVRDNKALARLRQDEMREMVRSYFTASLDRYVERLNDTGLPDRSLDLLRQELAAHEDAAEGHDDLSDLFLDLDAFRASACLTDAQWAENAPSLRREMRKARRDQIRAILSAAEGLEGYSFTKPAPTAPEPPQARSVALGTAIEDFMAEHSPQWSPEMQSKARAYLALLVEHFGQDRALAAITRQDAAEMKKLVQSLPANRNTRPETRDLTLQDAIAFPGLKKISAKTVNSYIDTFRRFWDWAERHGHAPVKLFDGMKVAKAKHADEGRKAYTPDQTGKLHAALTGKASGLVKKDDYKWGALLGVYTRADFQRLADHLRGIEGRFLMSINDVPEIREIFAWAEIGPVRTTYSVAGKGRIAAAAELLIRRG